MSNTLEGDPISHTAKFLWIFAAFPLIGQAMAFAMPPDMTANSSGPSRYAGFIIAAVIAAIGYGVWRRSLLAARIGLVLFVLASLGMVGLALFANEANRAGVILAVLPIWGAIKLYKVCEVLGTPPAPANP